jgi:hypothetical protein
VLSARLTHIACLACAVSVRLCDPLWATTVDLLGLPCTCVHLSVLLERLGKVGMRCLRWLSACIWLR